MLYRIFTERKNVKFITQLISEHYQGFTIFNTIGYWQGKHEKSLCIEIMSNNPADRHKLTKICKSINGYNKQDCCLLQIIECKSEFI